MKDQNMLLCGTEPFSEELRIPYALANKFMNLEFYRPACLAYLFDWTKPIHHRLNWLFVKLDSSKNILATEEHLAPKLKEHEILFRYGSEGLWILDEKAVSPYLRDDVAVPFSACYIFDKSIKSCPKPSFDMTTDSERSFNGAEVSAIEVELKRTNAVGYAADGCGLQWVSLDDQISSLIRDGFASWQKGRQNEG